jgi:hypothetical protein
MPDFLAKIKIVISYQIKQEQHCGMKNLLNIQYIRKTICSYY